MCKKNAKEKKIKRVKDYEKIQKSRIHVQSPITQKEMKKYKESMRLIELVSDNAKN